MTFRDERTQFACVVILIAIYVGISVYGGGSSTGELGQARAPQLQGQIPVVTLLLMLIATGIAFAPDRWRGVAPFAGISTAVLVVLPSAWSLLQGETPGIFARPFGEASQALMGLYVLNFICLSIGYGLFRLLKSVWRT